MHVRRIPALALAVAALAGLAPSIAPSQEESRRVVAAHPRIFLGARRLRLLRRERERQSLRWNQFHLLMAGKAPMPEPGFAQALYYRVSGSSEAGQQAVAWAPSIAPSQEESLRVDAAHPRIFLGARRLRLLRRERERQSLRWNQFHLLMAGKAPMPEPGFGHGS